MDKSANTPLKLGNLSTYYRPSLEDRLFLVDIEGLLSFVEEKDLDVLLAKHVVLDASGIAIDLGDEFAEERILLIGWPVRLSTMKLMELVIMSMDADLCVCYLRSVTRPIGAGPCACEVVHQNGCGDNDESCEHGDDGVEPHDGIVMFCR